MNRLPPVRALALLLLVMLVACASPGGRLQQAGTATALGMQLDSELDWARIRLPRQEVWTIDGTALNSLSIFSGIKPGEHVFMRGRERKSRPDGPWFRKGLRADEVRDIILDALREQQWTQVAASGLRPHRFGGVEGLRFELAMASQDGLIYAGTVAAVVKDDRLNLLLWKAPREHYHGRDAEAVGRMLDGMRFVP